LSLVDREPGLFAHWRWVRWCSHLDLHGEDWKAVRGGVDFGDGWCGGVDFGDGWCRTSDALRDVVAA